MSTLAERIIAEAETWIGTPFRHQGNLKGMGVDCAQFVAMVANEARGPKGEPIEVPRDYKPQEDGVIMMKLLGNNAEFVMTEDRQAGDVLALFSENLRDPDIPRHLVFVKEVTPKTTFIIHASRRGVVAHRLNGHWLARIHSCWRLKND